MKSHKSLRENWKVLKTDIFAQNTRFSRLSQVARKLPGPATRTLERTTFEKFSKCFLQLEVLLARELWSEPRKSLCTPRDWTFHLRINRQLELWKAWKPRFLKNILSLFRNWNIYSPLSRQWVAKNLCMGSQLGHVTGTTSDWVARTGHKFLKFWQIFVNTKYFPKTPKNSKIFLWLINKRLSMWKHI